MYSSIHSQMTSPTGSLTFARAYDPYGTPFATSGSSQTSYGFTSEFSSHGLTYLRARHYASGTGRFLTRDTWMGDYNHLLSLNQWAYVEGNPVNWVDPY